MSSVGIRPFLPVVRIIAKKGFREEMGPNRFHRKDLTSKLPGPGYVASLAAGGSDGD